jgi:hypothetical protein
MSKCGKPCCEELKLKLMLCSGCMIEEYCSPQCQKADWKVHRLMCASMKSSKKLLSFKEIRELTQILRDYAYASKNTYNNIRILEYCLSFAEHQFGEKIIGKSSVKKLDKEMSYENIDFNCIIPICVELCYLYSQHHTVDYLLEKNEVKDNIIIVSVNKAIYYSEKILYILKFWENQLGLVKSKQIQTFDDSLINKIYYNLAHVYCSFGASNMILGNKNETMDNTINIISYAKKITVSKEKIKFLNTGLNLKGGVLTILLKYDEARIVFEEAYNLVIEEYWVDHPIVLAAASSLINILIKLKEYYDADRYARITYECLMRSGDTQNRDLYFITKYLAEANYGLIITNKKKDGIDEIVMFLKKSRSICDKIYGLNHHNVLEVLCLLVEVLKFKKNENHDDEIKDLIELELNIVKKIRSNNNEMVLTVKKKLHDCYLSMATKLPPGNAVRDKYIKSCELLGDEIAINSIN